MVLAEAVPTAIPAYHRTLNRDETSMKNLYAAAAGGVMLIALSSCSQSSPSPPAPEATASMSFDGGLLTMQYEQAADGSSGSGAARLAGALAFEDGCVRVAGAAIVVPRPASWDGQTLTVGDQSFVLGDELEMGGASVRERRPGQPTDCPGEAFFTQRVELLADER